MTRRRFLIGGGAAAVAITAAGAQHGGGGNESDAAPPNSSRNRRKEKISGSISTPQRTAEEGTRTERETEETTPTEEEETEDEEDEPEQVTPLVGGNLNGRPRILDGNLQLLDASNTTWMRAFFDIRRKFSNGLHPKNDPDVVALRNAAQQRNCKLIVSLKWDFRVNWGGKEQMRVPRPGSTQERELLRCATRYLRHIGAPVDVVVLGNEPMWETLAADIKVENPPIVQFTRNVKDHLVRHGDHGDATYLLGSFNRIHDDKTRKQEFRQFHRAMFDLARDNDDIDGIDLHIHYGNVSEANESLAIAREAVPDGRITVTEFSPVWRYDRHKNTPIAGFEGGEEFAAIYDLPANMTVAEYLQRAKSNPVSSEELAAFYTSMPWYNVNHIDDMYDLFAEYDVSIATIGFVQTPRMRHGDWTTGWTPFHLNFLFQPALMHPDRRITQTALPQYLNDYRKHSTASPGGGTRGRERESSGVGALDVPQA